MPPAGVLFCLASAAAFGAMGVFGKLAYDEGATVGTLLATRFVLAAALFWLLVVCAGGARELRALSRRDVGIALALGAVGYGAQAGGYFAALERLDASLLSLLVYTFPVIVTVDRHRARARAGEPPYGRGPGARLDRPRPRPGGGRRGGAGRARDGARAGGGGRLQRVHPHLGGRRRARRAARPEHAGVHRCGDDPDARRPRRRRSGPRQRERGRLRLAGRPGRRVDGRGDRPVLRRAAARGPDGRVDPVDSRAGGHRRAGVRRVRRIARSRAARRRSAGPLGGARRPDAAGIRSPDSRQETA